MSNPIILIQPICPGLAEGAPFLLDLLIRVQAPEAPKDLPRPRLNLSLVLDRSGSMSGTPLEEAKRCAAEVILRMGSEDRVSVVAYDNRVNVVVPAQAVTHPEFMLDAVSRLRPGGNTDISAGLLAGIKELQSGVGAGVLSRMLLLSDGQANAGIVEPAALAAMAGKALEQGISTSTYGLGDEFEEDLMTRLAQGGGGRPYYGDTAEDLLEPFMEEFDFLRNACAQRLHLRIQASQGLKLTLRNGYQQVQQNTWVLPDLAYHAEAWAMFHLEGDAATLAALTVNGQVSLLEVALAWIDLNGQETELPITRFALPVVSAEEAKALPLNPMVKERLGELEAARIEAEIHEASLKGDMERVKLLLDLLHTLGKDNPWILGKAQTLKSLLDEGEDSKFRKETRYMQSCSNGGLRASEAMDSLHEPSYLRIRDRFGKREPKPIPLTSSTSQSPRSRKDKPQDPA